MLAHLGFFVHFFCESKNNLQLWDLIKTHCRTFYNKKFDMKTMIFKKMDEVKKV
jgi:hypothetical protein